MSNSVPPSLEEVWEWKRQTEEETKGMSREELIEFYHRKGLEAMRKLGVSGPTRPAGQARDMAKRAE